MRPALHVAMVMVAAFAGCTTVLGLDDLEYRDDAGVPPDASPPSGSVLWSRQIGGPGDDRVSGLAVDPSGDAVAGGCLGTVGAAPGCLDQADVFASRYSPEGELRWEKTFGDASSNQFAEDLAGGPSGTVITGYFQGNFGFGGPLLDERLEHLAVDAKLSQHRLRDVAAAGGAEHLHSLGQLALVFTRRDRGAFHFGDRLVERGGVRPPDEIRDVEEDERQHDQAEEPLQPASVPTHRIEHCHVENPGWVARENGPPQAGSDAPDLQSGGRPPEITDDLRVFLPARARKSDAA